MKFHNVVKVVLALVAFIGPMDARAGAQIELQVRPSAASQSQSQVLNLELNVQDGIVWIGNTLFQNYIVYDSKEKTVAIVDHNKGKYTVVSEAEVDEKLDELARTFAMFSLLFADVAEVGQGEVKGEPRRPEQIEKEVETMSEDELNQILLQQGARLKMEATGESRRISDGYADMHCQVYAFVIDTVDPQIQENIRKNRQHKNQVCVANAAGLDLGEQDLHTLQQFLQLAWRYMGRFPWADVLGIDLPVMGSEPIDGIPIQMHDLSEDSPPLMQVMLIQSADIMHADLIPKDYQRIDSSKDCVFGCGPSDFAGSKVTRSEDSPTTRESETVDSTNAVAPKKRVTVTQTKQNSRESRESAGRVKSRKKRKVIASNSGKATGPSQSAAAPASDCDFCPAMVVVPAGEFFMGAEASEQQQAEDLVVIARFELAEHEITREQYAGFVKETGYDGGSDCTNDAVLDLMAEEILKGNYDFDVSTVGGSWQHPGYEQAPDHPVVCVSFADAEAYVNWLNKKSGLQYRLPSEAEWEYAARAGSDTAYFWGDDIGQSDAIWAHGCGAKCTSTAAVGSLRANAFGLHDMHGNVYEWVKDDWLEDLKDAPKDGSANVSGSDDKVIRGGGYDSEAQHLESTHRWKIGGADVRSNGTGFRIARSIAH